MGGQTVIVRTWAGDVHLMEEAAFQLVRSLARAGEETPPCAIMRDSLRSSPERRFAVRLCFTTKWRRFRLC